MKGDGDAWQKWRQWEADLEKSVDDQAMFDIFRAVVEQNGAWIDSNQGANHPVENLAIWRLASDLVFSGGAKRRPLQHLVGPRSREFWKELRRSKNRHDMHAVPHDKVDDSIGRPNEFAEILQRVLGDMASGQGERVQDVHRGHDPLDDHRRVPGRISPDEVPDGLQIVRGLRRPPDPTHPKNRILTASWEIVSPDSDCANPRSTFARKYRRSMASSTVASSGRCSTVSTIFCFRPVDPMP